MILTLDCFTSMILIDSDAMIGRDRGRIFNVSLLILRSIIFPFVGDNSRSLSP